MKTHVIPSEINLHRPVPGHVPPWLRKAAFGAMISLLPTTPALAGGADGQYELVSAKGSIRFHGSTYTIPQRWIKRLVRVSDDHVTISDNRLQLQRNGAVHIVESFGDEIDMDLSAKVSGPTYVKLVRDGDGYSGSTASPITVSFKTDLWFFDFKGKLKVDVNAEVRNDTLTLTMPLSGKFLSRKISGKITVVCDRAIAE